MPLTTVALGAALLLVAAAATALPEAPLRVLAPLGAHALHVLAAFALGRAILRIPGAAPREALDVVISSLATGLIGLSLLSLAGAATVGCPAWLPWAVDGVALLTGVIFGRLREAWRRIAEPWSRRDIAVIVASRLPLQLALCLAVLLHVVPPFLPPTPATGAAALALPAQAALRGSLSAANAALPDAVASPTQGLLLHGFLAGGSTGALLFGATALALLAAAAWMHAERHLGDRTAAWTALVLLTVPVLLPETARDPSLEILLLYGFLAFHEVADWCMKATGGKIALASIFGGVLVAESARGLAAFGAVLLFLFLVQAFLDRNGVLRQLPGMLGMSGIALLVALPFVGIAGSMSPDGPLVQLAERHVPDPLRELAGLTPRPAGPELDVGSASEIVALLARRALLLGPLLLGLLAALPLVPLPPEALRHSVLGALLFAALAMLPSPQGGGALLALAPATMAAAATATALLALRGSVGAAGAAFVVLALPASAAMALALGPDTPLGTGLLLGRVPREDYVARHVPDAELVEMSARAGAAPGRSLLLVGSVTDVQYQGLLRRAPGLGVSVALDDLLRPPEPVDAIAVDRQTASPEELGALSGRVVLAESPDGRWAVLGVERRAVVESAIPPGPPSASASSSGATP